MNSVQAEQPVYGLAKPKIITGVNGDFVRTEFGQVADLDVGRDAVVSDGGAPLDTLVINIMNSGDYLSIYERIDIDTSGGRIALSDKSNPGSVISVDGIVIGTIRTSSDQWNWTIDFSDNAAPQLVQELVRSLKYTNTAEDYFIVQSEIWITMKNKANVVERSIARVMAVDGDTSVFTPDVDRLEGTNGDDVFYAPAIGLADEDEIHGGEGEDTLALYGSVPTFNLNSLARFSGIEFIEGTRNDEIISMRSDQLEGVREIRGGGGMDTLALSGTIIDLRSVELMEVEEIRLSDSDSTITLDNAEHAKRVIGYNSQNETLVLTTGTLSEVERLAIHRQGIDTIIAKDENGGDIITTHHAPEVTALDGDQIRISTGAVVFIDAGKDSVLSAEDGILGYLGVRIKSGATEGDLLRFDTPEGGRITISDGYQNFSRISVNGVEIGAFNNFTNATALHIQLYEDATPERVQVLLRALTYTNTNGPIGSQRVIEIMLDDIGGRSTSANITVNPWEWSAIQVTEGLGAGTKVGTLAAQGSNGQDVTYTLTGASADLFELEPDSEGGYNVVVKEGVILNYEVLAHRSFDVRIRDSNGVTDDRTFSLILVDEDEAPVAAFAPVSVIEGVGGNTVVGTVLAFDPEDSEEFECTLSSSSEEFFELRSYNKGVYTVVVKSGVVLDHENLAHRSFTLSISDGSGNTLEKTFNLALEDVDESPTLVFTPDTVSEGAGGSTVVGRILATDPEGKALTYTLVGTSADLFRLEMDPVGGQRIIVKNGIVLDYENPIHRNVTISVTNGVETNQVTYSLNLMDVVDVWTGTRGKDTLRGQSGADIIKGLAGDDKLYGDAGNDTLYGGSGNDRLKGDEGNDTFVFNSKLNKRTNKDKIIDFSVADDAIWLDNKVFTKLGAAGSETGPEQLRKSHFVVGSKAKDRDDFVVYDKTKGILYYDADGSGGGKAVEIATLSKNLRITEKDLFVV